jgi:hypothetical protein
VVAAPGPAPAAGRTRSRARFRDELEVDDATWRRGRGWVISHGVGALAYYWNTNPGMVRRASHALAEALTDTP